MSPNTVGILTHQSLKKVILIKIIFNFKKLFFSNITQENNYKSIECV